MSDEVDQVETTEAEAPLMDFSPGMSEEAFNESFNNESDEGGDSSESSVQEDVVQDSESQELAETPEQSSDEPEQPNEDDGDFDFDALDASLKGQHPKVRAKMLKKALREQVQSSKDKEAQRVEAQNQAQAKIDADLSTKSSEIDNLNAQIEFLNKQTAISNDDDMLANLATDPSKTMDDWAAQRENKQNVQNLEANRNQIQQQIVNQQALQQRGVTLTGDVMDKVGNYMLKQNYTQAQVNSFKANPYLENPSSVEYIVKAAESQSLLDIRDAEIATLKGKSNKVINNALDAANNGPSINGSAPSVASSGDENKPISHQDVRYMNEKEVDRYLANLSKGDLV